MLMGQRLSGVEYTMQIRLHKISYNIDVLIPSPPRWLLHLQKRYHILMIKKLQKLDLPINPLRIDQVIERLRYLFDCYLLPCFAIQR